MLEDSLMTIERALASDDPEIANRLNNLATLYLRIQDFPRINNFRNSSVQKFNNSRISGGYGFKISRIQESGILFGH